MTSSQGVRKEPLTVTITTASTNLDGPFATIELPNYKKILEGEIEDDTIFASIFEMDEGDSWEDESTWLKCQPHMGITVNLDFYKRSYAKALRNSDDLIEFKTKLLNSFTPEAKVDWISPKIIENNTISLKLEDITTMPLCMVACDLSVKDDFSCVSYGLYDSIAKSFTFINHYYIPKNTIYEHTNSELYQKWANDGYLHICGEDTINYEQIGQDIINASRYVRIIGVNYDAYKNRNLTNYLKAQGIKCLTPYRQVYSAFTSPLEAFQSGIYEGKMKIDSNPINQWCITNCVIDQDSMGNMKPMKITATRKIDGCICILMSLGAFMSYKR